MEPRAAVGDYNSGTDTITLYTTSQNPHVARLVLAAFIGLAPENKLRVIAPDVGGGFGSKIFIYAEETVCAWAAKKIDRPVKWTSDRTEAFLSDAHGRDHVTHAELALDASGKITGMRVHTIANLGAYLSTFASLRADLPLRGAALGPVRYPKHLLRGRRGLHQHRAGRRLSRRRASGGDLRRRTSRRSRGARNAGRSSRVPTQELRHLFPASDAGQSWPMTWAITRCARQGAGARRLQGRRRAQGASAAKGKLRGIGMSAYIEACGTSAVSARSPRWARGVGGWESAEVRVNPTGHGRGDDRARTVTARATRRPSRSWSPRASAFRWKACTDRPRRH